MHLLTVSYLFVVHFKDSFTLVLPQASCIRSFTMNLLQQGNDAKDFVLQIITEFPINTG